MHPSKIEKDDVMETAKSNGNPLLTRILIPALITIGGIVTAFVFLSTKPEPETAPPVRTARLVETIILSPVSHRIEIEAMGLVKAKSSIQLKPRISGQIAEVSATLIPGQTFKKGELTYRIDPTDYELALLSQQANYQQAEATYLIEKGQQAIAKADYEMTGQTLTGAGLDLVLRKPQLMQAEAIASNAKAQLKVAELNLGRTKITAPFDGLILEKSESVGSIVNNSTTLATLADCTEFWIELAIPVRDTRWIGAEASEPPKVMVYDEVAWGKGVYREGKLVSLSNHVNEDSKMATVTVSIDDPLALRPENQGKPKLILGAFIRAKIEGKELDNVLVLNRDYLRLDNTVWTLDRENRLKFRDVEVIYSGPDTVVIQGEFAPDTKIVTSNLSVPVEGMLLRYDDPEQGSAIPRLQSGESASTNR
jgi:RND family efflux transporter MFP subunit